MRCFGLLLHISSLPSPFGIGDLGPAAHDFARLLARIGARVWQFLPLNPTSTFIGNSPYSSPSAFAGNPVFISPELLLRDGYILKEDLEASGYSLSTRSATGQDPSRVDFEAVSRHRHQLLNNAFDRSRPKLEMSADFQEFCRRHDHWLHDYALYISLKQQCRLGGTWADWPERYRDRQPEALREWADRAHAAILREKFIQFLFFSQWAELHDLCRELGISLVSDVPIYVTLDSADVWANPHLFQLDERFQPERVSGVPPDYFSETGQKWGTPLYRWDAMKKDGYSWWIRRLEHVLALSDMARLDHFRGFCGHWSIPAGEETAINGRWEKGPGADIFSSLQARLGSLPFIAEDLGVISADVRQTMTEFALPGMHVLQFAFEGENPAANPSIPHKHTAQSAVYTGTHDNPPARAWFKEIPQLTRDNLAAYLDRPMEEQWAAYCLTRLAFASVADLAVIPMQDALDLGREARMNTPGTPSGNWEWRMTPEEAVIDRIAWLEKLAALYGRLPVDEDIEEEDPLY